MAESLSTETESLPPIFSPQRFFLDAPKQPPGTCFVLNEDFQKAMAEVGRLRARIKEHEQFRHQHRDCDQMGIAIHQARLILNAVQSPDTRRANP